MNWSATSNWVSNSAPPSDPDTQLNFAGVAGLLNINDLGDPFTLNSLSFASAGAFSLSGGGLRFVVSTASFQPLIFQNSAPVEVINNNLVLAANLFVNTAAGSGTLTLGGSLTGSGTLIKAGAGTLMLTGAGSSFTGGLTINTGTVQITNASTLNNGNDVIVNAPGGLNLSGPQNESIGALSGSGSLNLGATQLTTTGAASTFSGTITGGSGGILKQGGGALVLSGTGSNVAGPITAYGAPLIFSGGSFTASASMTATNSGTFTVQNGAHLSGPAGNLAIITRLCSALVTDAISKWDGFSQLLVGGNAGATVTVQNGATLGASNGEALIIGPTPGDNGTVLVQGGGHVGVSFSILGNTSGTSAQATVTGAGSTWNSKVLEFGLDLSDLGSGVMTVSAGGAVSVTDSTTFYGAPPPAGAAANIVVNGGTYSTALLSSGGSGAGSIDLLADPAGGTQQGLVISGGGNATFSGTIFGGGSVLKSGTATQVLAGSGLWGGGTRITAGTLKLGAGNALGPGSLSLSAGATFDLAGFDQTVSALSGAGGVITLGNNHNTLTVGGFLDTIFGGTITGQNANLTKTGVGSLTFSSSAGVSIGGASGTLSLMQGEIDISCAALTATNLNINGGILRVTAGAGGTRVLRTSNLAINPANSLLDLEDNKLIVTAVGATGSWNGSAYTGVSGLLQGGHTPAMGVNWSGGDGITTAQSAAQFSNYTSLGVARASDIGISGTGVWAGQTVSSSDTLVMYTYGGDANLDGKLNIDDYVKIDQGVAAGLTGWSNGDFNYDGKVNIDDYTTVIDANIGSQSGVFPSTSGVTAVPEPIGTTLIVPAILLASHRARRTVRPNAHG